MIAFLCHKGGFGSLLTAKRKMNDEFVGGSNYGTL